MHSLIMTILSRSATRAHELSAANASRGRSGHTHRPKCSTRRYLEYRKCTLYRLASYYYQRKFDDRHHSMDVPSYCGPIGTAAEDLLPGNGTEACWGFASLNDEYRLNVWQIAIRHIRYDIHTWPRELTGSQLNREPSARSQGTEM